VSNDNKVSEVTIEDTEASIMLKPIKGNCSIKKVKIPVIAFIDWLRATRGLKFGENIAVRQYNPSIRDYEELDSIEFEVVNVPEGFELEPLRPF